MTIEELKNIKEKVAFWVDSQELFDELVNAGIFMTHKYNGVSGYSNRATYSDKNTLEKNIEYWASSNILFYTLKNIHYEIY